MTVRLEPFPLFMDGAPPDAASYFASSQMGKSLSTLSPSGVTRLNKARTSITSKLTAHLRLRYYQYELTLGLYVMTPMEKLVFNLIILTILAAVSYALYWGLEPFVIRTLCRLVYYITGSFEVTSELCAQQYHPRRWFHST